MVYRKENGVIVPYANNSGQNVAADINIIDKNGKVVSAGGTTNIQALVSKISDDTVELSSDLASVNGLLNGFHFLTTDKGPSGNQSVDSIRLWCKENGAAYNLGAYYTWVFNGWYWSQVLICNKMISPTYAQVIITNTQGIMFTTTTQLDQQTPTWDTKTIAFS